MKLHLLVQKLIDTHGATPVELATLDAFVAAPGDHVLFFSGDPVRFPECLDIAVVLPELVATFRGAFNVGVVLRGTEDAVARRFGVQRWPSLVFLRDGLYVATVAGMKNWDDYLEEVSNALATTPTRAPTVGIPVLAADAGSSSCH
jgi:hydrogenase-1 operon protein HyaE